MGVTAIASLDDFHAAVGGERTAIVSFGAVWAGASKTLAPVFEQFSDQHPDLAFFKVDVDAAKDVATEAGALSVPAFVAYKGGNGVAQVKGVNVIALKDMIDGL